MTLPNQINKQDRLLCVHTDEIAPVDIGDVMPGLKIWPLFLDSENGYWVIRMEAAPGMSVPMHFHTGTVHFYQISGRWNYSEYPDDEMGPNSYLYEPGGSIHTFNVPSDATEPANGFMVVHGANVNFDADGEYLSIMDTGWLEHVIHECCKQQGRAVPRYVKPKAAAGFSDA